MSGNPENQDRREPVQGPDTVVPFVPKSERVRPIIPRWESDPAPPSGQGTPGDANGDEGGDDPGPTAA